VFFFFGYLFSFCICNIKKKKVTLEYLNSLEFLHYAELNVRFAGRAGSLRDAAPLPKSGAKHPKPTPRKANTNSYLCLHLALCRFEKSLSPPPTSYPPLPPEFFAAQIEPEKPFTA